MLEPRVPQQDPGQDFHLEIKKSELPGEELSIEHRDALIRMSADSVKHLAKTSRKLEDNQKWMTENFPPLEEMVIFLQNIPTAILMLISAGVMQQSFRSWARPIQNGQDE
jgi:hypothetical protein